MQQIYRRTPSNFIEIALPHGCSPVHLLHIFRTPFLRSTTGWLLLRKVELFKNICDVLRVRDSGAKLQSATLLKVTLLYGCFSHFLNCINGTKLRHASHIETESWLKLTSLSKPLKRPCVNLKTLKMITTKSMKRRKRSNL